MQQLRWRRMPIQRSISVRVLMTMPILRNNILKKQELKTTKKTLVLLVYKRAFHCFLS